MGYMTLEPIEPRYVDYMSKLADHGDLRILFPCADLWQKVERGRLLKLHHIMMSPDLNTKNTDNCCNDR